MIDLGGDVRVDGVDKKRLLLLGRACDMASARAAQWLCQQQSRVGFVEDP